MIVSRTVNLYVYTPSCNCSQYSVAAFVADKVEADGRLLLPLVAGYCSSGSEDAAPLRVVDFAGNVTVLLAPALATGAC